LVGDGSSIASDSEDDLSEVSDNPTPIPDAGEEPQEITDVERFVESQQLLEEKKTEMQECVGQVLEDPEGNV